MNKLIGLLFAAILLAALPLEDAVGRGFGGFRGGGFGGGGFGGSRGGDFGGGGFRDRDLGGGGWAGARGDSGGFRGEDFRRNFAGDTGGFRSERMDAFRGGEGRRLDEGGDRLRTLPDRDFSGVSRTRLDSFLGLPTDAGVSHVAGFSGARVTAGRVEGPRGGSAGFVSGTHIHYVPPEMRSAQAWNVRHNFNRHHIFNPDWWRHHPGAWVAAGVAASAWAAASWSGVADWVGCDATPEDYDYGSTVLYQGDNVYMEGQPEGSATEYYDQASSLANSGAASQDDQSQWMPLGVFGMVQGDQTDPTMIFQLAVNKQGIIRGNFFSTVTQTTLPVKGAVNKKTQRAAWTIGDNKDTVFDTGLYNLTKDEAPALVHFGKDSTQQWLMVRLKSKADVQKDS
ncbi:MAG: hypothetical protein HY912_04700 [Desulfomonile tiedjei]|uniref:Uncharacterized protein n=1 Tax=Desulfomonile tiedjei TaxID=2358 RepID=A0A9D6YZG2_9BACT|nr:hypothetical protein [Desulfomonile tiedjei]